MQSQSYDYVIVGAGTAGCTLANRLTADGKYSVLLLEAGPADKSPWIHIPLGYAKLFTNATYNWCFRTEAEPGTAGRETFYPRGKTLGGSSSINGLLYLRGQPEDYDHWADLGNRGWGWRDVLPYFIKGEGNSRGADKIIYGGYFPMGRAVDRIMNDMQDLPLKENVWPEFLRDNARKVLKLDG